LLINSGPQQAFLQTGVSIDDQKILPSFRGQSKLMITMPPQKTPPLLKAIVVAVDPDQLDHWLEVKEFKELVEVEQALERA